MADRPPILSPDPRRPRALPRTLAGATVLQIVPSLRDAPASRAAREVAGGLLQSGARAFVAGAGGPLVGKLQTAGGEWIPLVNDTINPLKLRRNAKLLERLITAERVDIVHAYSAGAAWSALAATAHMPVWLVTTLDEAPTPPGWLRAFYAGALARGDRVIASSSFIAGRAMGRYGIARERIAVIPHSVDTRFFDPATVDKRRLAAFRMAARIHGNERVVLLPGRIAAANGQHILVDAVRILADRGMRDVIVVLAGDDQSHRNYTRAITSRIQRFGLEPIFRITALFHDLPAAFAAAHVVVLPSLEPPVLGRVAVEAQAMARPVVTTQIGVLPECVLAPPRMPDELRSGWAVRPGHPMELAGAIAAVLRLDDTAYQALAARARQFAQFMFSPESIVAATRAVYTSLLARDR
jgi:glycosyltransferase involved in cell wall biosynthesis